MRGDGGEEEKTGRRRDQEPRAEDQEPRERRIRSCAAEVTGLYRKGTQGLEGFRTGVG